MRCPNHPDARVYDPGTTSRTAMTSQSFWEDGVLHVHDPNHHSAGYSCSKGCRIVVDWIPICPATGCEFGADSATTTVTPPDREARP